MHAHYCGSPAHDIPLGFLGLYVSFPDLPWMLLATIRHYRAKFRKVTS